MHQHWTYSVAESTAADDDSLLAGLCSNAVKGMASLIGSGTVRNSPPAIAAFLREHKDELDTTQIGEYFGHHEEQAVWPSPHTPDARSTGTRSRMQHRLPMTHPCQQCLVYLLQTSVSALQP